MLPCTMLRSDNSAACARPLHRWAMRVKRVLMGAELMQNADDGLRAAGARGGRGGLMRGGRYQHKAARGAPW